MIALHKYNVTCLPFTSTDDFQKFKARPKFITKLETDRNVVRNKEAFVSQIKVAACSLHPFGECILCFIFETKMLRANCLSLG